MPTVLFTRAINCNTARMKKGYVRQETNGDFTYVYQCKDHLGNVRLSYADSDGDGVITKAELIEESNYYPFGMQHIGYNSGTLSSNLGQKIKYQGQERQDELGLNWDSFKWRNYDYAIGRFFNVDPLAEKYAYNGVYNFSENRVINAVELEGLEAVKVTDLKNHTVNVTVKIKAVNSTYGYYKLNDTQIEKAKSNIKSQAERSWSGKVGDMKVNVNIVWDDKATLTANFVDVVENPYMEEKSTEFKIRNAQSPGYTDPVDNGNTQTGTFQISSANTFWWSPDDDINKKNNPNYSKTGAGHTGNHELGHIFGNGESNGKEKSNEQNVMNQQGNGREVNEKQRKTMLDNIPEEKL